MDFVQSRFPAMRTLTVSPNTPREKAATSSDRRRVPGAEGAGLGGQAGHAAVEAHQLVSSRPSDISCTAADIGRWRHRPPSGSA